MESRQQPGIKKGDGLSRMWGQNWSVVRVTVKGKESAWAPWLIPRSLMEVRSQKAEVV